MNLNLSERQHVRMIYSKNSWIEGDAARQLHQVAALAGMVRTVGLPDMHPGKCSPVGAAYLSKGILYPTLIGNDVGCGIGLFSTHLKRTKIKKDKWIKKLKGLEQPYDGDLDEWRLPFGLDNRPDDIALGTIGGGNHFAELQSIEKVFDDAILDKIGIDKNRLVILVHSGSRSIGEALFRDHAGKHGAKGLDADSTEAQRYLAAHDRALKWAVCNRALISFRFAACLGAESAPVIDVSHNSIVRKPGEDGTFWLHRKGAAASEKGLVVIPGSRGSLSYLVKTKGDQEDNLWSLPHGAGRKWSRGSCKAKLRHRYPAQALMQTALGSCVICEDKDLLYEEAPQAYKKIDTVIEDLIKADLIEVVAALKPMITYKVRKNRI